LKCQFGISSYRGDGMADQKVREMEPVETQIVEIMPPDVENLIYVVRNKQVMVDSDLAMLYQVETGALNRAVDGQIYDAFSLLIGLIQKAEMEIVLVDGYVDVGTLNILSKKKENVAVTVYTQQRTKLSQTDVDNFNVQYPKLDVKYTRAFHDRFLILDKTKAYHVGASLKDAGKKCFGINLIEDAGIVRDILQRLELETEE
jgi:hypothetical protein